MEQESPALSDAPHCNDIHKICEKVLGTQLDATLLAKIVATELSAPQTRLSSSTPSPRAIENCARQNIPLLELIEALAANAGLALEELVQNDSHYNECVAMADAFKKDIAPTRLGTLQHNPRSFMDRVRAFWNNRGVPDEKLLRRFDQLVLASAPPALIPELREYIRRKFRPSLIATYAQPQIEQIADNLLTWYPVVRFLATRTCQTMSIQKAEQELASLLGKISKTLQARWSCGAGEWTADAAVSEAVLRVLEHWEDPDGGYRYAGPLPHWIAAVAENILRSNCNTPQPPSAPPAPEPEDDMERLTMIRERYQLVETFFQVKAQSRVKVIWKDLVLHMWKNGDISDEEMERELESAPNITISPSDLYTPRRRLRQRMTALVAGLRATSPEPPGDMAVLEKVAQETGWDKTDLPTLRHLAALGRAARDEETLAWAFLARVLVDTKLEPEKACQRVRAMLDSARSAGLISPNTEPRDKARLCEALERFRADQCDQKLTRVHTQAKMPDWRIDFFVSPGWYLHQERKRSSENTADTLNPALGDERDHLLKLLKQMK